MICAGFLAVNFCKMQIKTVQTMSDSAALASGTAMVIPLWEEFFEQVAVVDVPGVGRVAFLRSIDSDAFEDLQDMRMLYSLFPEGSLVMGEGSLRRVFGKLPTEYRGTPLVPLGDMRHRRVEFSHQTFHVLFKEGMRTNFVTWGILDLMNHVFIVAVHVP
jgi:hypothetical protein